ncbi:MAG: ferredoxin [Clostridiales bacterium]|nr:ferredoxin [Clostridiales bacterium]
MKVVIYDDRCIGCGLCESIEPKVFLITDYNVAEVVMQPETFDGPVQAAVESCPTDAIAIITD